MTSTLRWDAAGTFEVGPGVYRIPLPLPNDGLRAVNVYAVVDGDELTLIDAGWSIPEAREALELGLASFDAALSDIRRFLITHAHRDHYTQAVAVRRDLGTPVALGCGEQPALALLNQPGRLPLAEHVDRLTRVGAASLHDRLRRELQAHGPTDDFERPDVWLSPGPLHLAPGRTLQALHTPGHTAGHLVFYDFHAGLLFAGDHVLPRITPSVGFEPTLFENPLAAYLSSLAAVRALPDARLLPAHGEVTDSVHRRVDELIEHHGKRLEETTRAVRAGDVTAYDVARSLRWTKQSRQLADLDIFNQLLAIFETSAHLELLAAQGRLEARLEGDVLTYRLQ